ncbi:MAG: sn-glycerol-3-phosphate ABC transporter ATP-binding protein UgpC [Candidatus Eisenbacteria bacterium]|nr:sn-glycerol-3-phosphate ABC transporter ATP-binding protein UgpC [Candidatus Eisenbacteria bacterium]
MAGVVLRNLVKSYGKGKPVLKNVNLEIGDREFMVLVGPSGCGKSTVLRVISGLEDVDGGEVRIDDRLVNGVPPRERDVAMVFQNYALYPHMTVYENIAFGLRVRGFGRDEIDKLVREAAEVLNLSPFLAKLPKQLSGGERQRVALGRAIVRKPKVFLFDEPLSNLDAKLRVQMRAEISALHRRLRITTVYVTHDQVEAMTMGERITVIRSGEIQQVARPLDLYRQPANRFVAEFIGSPPMNILPVLWDGESMTVAGVKIDLRGERLGLPEELRGKGVLLGVRPEKVEVFAGGGGVPAQIDLVEPMGGESNIYLRVEGKRVIARIEGDTPLRAGEEASIRFPVSEAHFFHGETGVRIGRSGESETIAAPAAPPPPPEEETRRRAPAAPSEGPPRRKRVALWWAIGVTAVLAVLLGFYFGGRSGGGRSAAGPGEAVEITIWQMMDPPEKALFEELVYEFTRAHPNWTISQTHFAPDNLRTQFLTSALGGGGPEIIYGPSDQVGPLSTAETILPIDEVFSDEFLGQFIPLAFDTLNGHVWQLPARVGNHLTLLYNREMLAEPPATLRDLVRVARELTIDTNGDGAPDRYGLVFNIKEPFWLVPFLGAWGGWVMDREYRPTLDTPAMVGALRFLQEMRRGKKIMPEDCNYEVAHTLFQEKKAAMLINGPWSWRGYEEAGVDFGLAPIPKNDETGYWPSPMISSVGYSVNANVKPEKLERVKELLDYLTSPEVQIRYVERLWTIPTRKAALEDPKVQSHPRVADSWEQYRHGRRMPVVTEMRAIWDAMRPAYQNVLNGEATPVEAARKMQSDAIKKIKEMNE